jgi:hypothetical protein
VSRAYNARRKARRRQSRTERDAVADARSSKPRRLVAPLPAVAIIGILGFGVCGGISRKQIQQEVTADLERPTVTALREEASTMLPPSDSSELKKGTWEK